MLAPGVSSLQTRKGRRRELRHLVPLAQLASLQGWRPTWFRLALELPFHTVSPCPSGGQPTYLEAGAVVPNLVAPPGTSLRAIPPFCPYPGLSGKVSSWWKEGERL